MPGPKLVEPRAATPFHSPHMMMNPTDLHHGDIQQVYDGAGASTSNDSSQSYSWQQHQARPLDRTMHLPPYQAQVPYFRNEHNHSDENSSGQGRTRSRERSRSTRRGRSRSKGHARRNHGRFIWQRLLRPPRLTTRNRKDSSCHRSKPARAKSTTLSRIHKQTRQRFRRGCVRRTRSQNPCSHQIISATAIPVRR